MSNFVNVTGQELYSSSATAVHGVGQEGRDGKGRKYRYVKAGAVALVAGNVVQAPAQNTGHDQLTPSAASVGDTTITVTPDSGSITANQYAGGYAMIDTTPGEGYSYRIASHPAWTSGTLVLTLDPSDSIKVALTTASRVTLVPHPYTGVIQAPVTTATNVAVGVAIYPIAISEYGWVQTSGPCPTLINGTPAVGAMVVATGSTAGAAAIASSTLQVIGQMMVTGVNGKILPVFLNIE